ncbi:MAG: glutathione S-transferase family protein [Polyangiales bacterium]
MTITLYHHPFSRASTVVWMLEEVGVPYELSYVDFTTGAQKKPDFLAINPMGKLPTLVDGDVVATEVAAIGLYLADRYAHGKLAPALDDPARATYFRWALYAPSVIEPGSVAKASKWEFKASQVGWGDYASMLETIERAVSHGDFLLGERFTMADVIFGATLRYMLRFNMIEPRAAYRAYIDRLEARPALARADAINARIAKEHNLG